MLDLQVADKIRRDERVLVIERTNLRYLSQLPQQVDLVTLDLSFISILLVCSEMVAIYLGDCFCQMTNLLKTLNVKPDNNQKLPLMLA